MVLDSSPTFEDKLAQRAIVMVLEAAYERALRCGLLLSTGPERPEGIAARPVVPG
jgi:hypothetical protein